MAPSALSSFPRTAALTLLALILASYVTQLSASAPQLHSTPTSDAPVTRTTDKRALVDCPFNPTSPSDFGYYDNLRCLNTTQYETDPFSSIQHVTVPEGRLKKKYRLMHIGIFLPGASIDEKGVALLAAHHYNNRNGSVVPQLEEQDDCGIRITLEFFDTEQSPSVAAEVFYDDILASRIRDCANEGEGGCGIGGSDPYPTALIGALFSRVSSTLAILSSTADIPEISHASTSAYLDEPQYEMFGRVIPNSAGDANAAIQYLSRELGVGHLGVLHWGDGYGNAYANSVDRSARKEGMKVVKASIRIDGSDESIANKTKEALSQLNSSGYRYFIGIFFGAQSDVIWREIHNANMAGPGYFWMFSETLGDFAILKIRDGMDDPITQVLHGSAIIKLADDREIMIRRRGYRKFLENWPEGLIETVAGDSYAREKISVMNPKQKFNPEPNWLSLFMYDAVMSLGLAACNIKSRGKDVPKSSRSFFRGKDLFRTFKSTKFDGATGRVRMNTDTGTRDYKTVVYTLINVRIEKVVNGKVHFEGQTTATYESESRRVTPYSNDANEPKWIPLEGASFIYSDNTTNPPSDLPPHDVEEVIISSGYQIAGWILCGLILSLSLLCGIWTTYNRKTKIIRKAQPEFLIMLCVGTLIMGSAIVPMSLTEEQVKDADLLDGACMAVPWLLSIGFVVTFSALLAKQMRINKIFQTKQFRRVKVEAKDVLTPFLVLMTLNLIILIVWTVIGPIPYSHELGSSTDRYERPLTSTGLCSFEDSPNKNASIACLASLVILHVCVVIYANWEAYKARKVQTEYSESRYIAICMATILQSMLIGLPAFSLSVDEPSSRFIFGTALILVVCGAVLIPIFLPKLFFMRQWRQEAAAKEALKKARKENILSFPSQTGSSHSSTEEGGGMKIVNPDEAQTLQNAALKEKLAQAKHQTVQLKEQNVNVRRDVNRMKQSMAVNATVSQRVVAESLSVGTIKEMV